MVSKLYAMANNPMVIAYDPSKKNTYIVYLGANNLYCWAMSLPLPKKDFKRMRVMPTEKDIRKKKQAEKGWTLEADSKYLPELHKDHNSYPLAPEEKVMKIELSSDYPDLAEQQRKAGSHTARQKKICGSLQKPAVIGRTRDASSEGAQGAGVLTRVLGGAVHLDEH